MGSTRDERRVLEDFSHRYGERPGDVADRVERAVIGEAWGANGYTTVEQAELLQEKLRLQPGELLLDLGSGCGWPGLFLARGSGCGVVLTDLPVEGLELALGRAEAERIGAVRAVACSARELPFREGIFDAVVHTDVLC